METTSPYALTRDVEMAVKNVLSGVDIYNMDPGLAAAVRALKRQLADLRLDIREYELAETRQNQVRAAQRSREQLTEARKSLLAATEANVFSAAQIAQFSAQLEHILEYLG